MATFWSKWPQHKAVFLLIGLVLGSGTTLLCTQLSSERGGDSSASVAEDAGAGDADAESPDDLCNVRVAAKEAEADLVKTATQRCTDLPPDPLRQCVKEHRAPTTAARIVQTPSGVSTPNRAFHCYDYVGAKGDVTKVCYFVVGEGNERFAFALMSPPEFGHHHGSAAFADDAGATSAIKRLLEQVPVGFDQLYVIGNYDPSWEATSSVSIPPPEMRLLPACDRDQNELTDNPRLAINRAQVLFTKIEKLTGTRYSGKLHCTLHDYGLLRQMPMWLFLQPGSVSRRIDAQTRMCTALDLGTADGACGKLRAVLGSDDYDAQDLFKRLVREKWSAIVASANVVLPKVETGAVATAYGKDEQRALVRAIMERLVDGPTEDQCDACVTDFYAGLRSMCLRRPKRLADAGAEADSGGESGSNVARGSLGATIHPATDAIPADWRTSDVRAKPCFDKIGDRSGIYDWMCPDAYDESLCVEKAGPPSKASEDIRIMNQAVFEADRRSVIVGRYSVLDHQ